MRELTPWQFQKYIHKHLGLYASQREMAENLGVSPSYLNDILNGRREPGDKFLKALGYKRVVLYVPDDERKD